MKVGFQIDGVETLKKELDAMRKSVKAELKKAVAATAYDIHGTAIKSIQAHQSSGRTSQRGGVTHTASQPGNPPNSDTGRLVASIQVSEVGDTEAIVYTDLYYGRDLEYGIDGRVAARPWLTPSVEANRRNFERRVNRVLGGEQ
jgi:hypothetical protein